MAENDNKFPPPPHGMPYQYPGGPWPSVFPHHKKEDGKWPRPPMPWHNDTEPVVGVYPWENCCEDQDPCMCVTSADVEKWDGTHNVVSANSAYWGGEYDDSWKNSAALWQGASETVKTHSAYWDSAWSIASGYDPNALDPIISILSGTSAFLRTYSGELEVQTKEWIKGNGTAKNPIQLSQAAVDRLKNVQELITQLYGGAIDEKTRKWLKTNDLDEFVEWLKAIDALMFMVDPNMIDYTSIIEQMDKDITSPSASILGASGGGIFIQLNKIWAILRNMEHWVVETTRETVAQWGDSADKWNWTWDAVNTSADRWNKTAESASFWNSACNIVGDHYENWNETYNIVNNSSVNWNSAYSAVVNSGGYWNSAYNVVNNSSVYWNSAYSAIVNSAQSWNETYNIINNSSQYWNNVYSAYINSASYWNSAYTNITEIENNSANIWNEVYNIVSANSGEWGSQDTSWKTSAEKWEASYSAVAKNSAFWASGSHETWKYEADMTPQNAAQFNAPGVFYYNEN